MRKYLLAGLFCMFTGNAHADGKPTFEVGYSSFAVQGVICTTGTATQLNSSRPAGIRGRVAGYLIQNQDSADSIWIGDQDVDATAGGGIKLVAGSDFPFAMGKTNSQTTTPVWCEADSAAGAAAAQVVLVWYFY